MKLYPVALSLLTFCAVSLSGIVPAIASPPERVHYTVTVADTAKKRFHISVRLEGVSEETVRVAIPAWSPGFYTLTHAEKNISNVTATDEKKTSLSVSHPDANTWQLPTRGLKQVTVEYDLFARNQDAEETGLPGGKDYGFMAPYLDAENGFVPGPASLLYVVDGKIAPCQVTYAVPKGWKVASANDPVTGEENTFSAPNYDFLADQPGELGTFDRFDKTIAGVPFSIIVTGGAGKNPEKLVNATWKLAESGIRVFGEAPFPRYIFHLHFLENSPAMMGLEHLNGTVILMPLKAMAADESTCEIVAHEYIHAWNVKRIRSKALGPFDYTKPVRVKDLWWLEGVTDYYAPRLMVDAGLATEVFWQSFISEILTGVQNNPARKQVTLETASLKAWEGHSEGFGGLSYYEKGLLVGVLLDVEMRKRTANRVSLDDLFKALLKETQETGAGFPDGEIERLASKLTNSDFGPFFEKALRSTDELDYEGILKGSGLRLETMKTELPDFGIDTRSITLSNGGLRIGTVVKGGPAARAGMRNEDVIMTIEGKSIDAISGSVFDDKNPGDTVRLTVKRGTKTMPLTITIGTTTVALSALVPAKDATPEERAIYRGMTGTASK